MGPNFRRFATATVAVVLTASSLLLAQSAPLDTGRGKPPPRSKASREQSDWEIATIVRTAFWQDRDLAPLNLQVSVEQGIATVDGPVPSGYLRRKAIALVEAMRGIRGVRDQVRVRAAPSSGAPGARYFPPVDQAWPKTGESVKPPEAPLMAPARAEPASPGSLMSRPAEDEQPTPTSMDNWKPASGQGYWVPSNSVRAGLLPPQKMPEEQPKVGLGTPVAKP